MADTFLNGLSAILLPKGRGTKGGKAAPPEFVRGQPEITAPTYRQHLEDVFDTRLANDTRTLLPDLFNSDADVSAAVTAFLAVAGSVQPIVKAYNEQNELDPEGIAMGNALMALVTNTQDYTIGFSNKPTVEALCNQHRYMTLLRGGTSCELVLDKTFVPSELRIVDMAELTWEQPQPGVFKPIQTPGSSNEEIDLNIPTFFTSTFHQSPRSMYTFSPFVSAINTIASRQLVINELYRIMKIVGYPRIDVKVLEDVLFQSAPPAWRTDPAKMREFVQNELTRIQGTISQLESGDAFVHSSAIEASVINDKNPSAGLQIQGVIDVLNAQNQAALKVMPAVVGKGSNGQVASTEARLFALNADALNRSIASLFTKAFTLAARLAGYPGRVVVEFPPVELRPDLELEPQRTMRATRLKTDLSLGIISDDEYAMAIYHRPTLSGAPPLSGTNFENTGTQIDVEGVSPNDDPLGRSLSGEGGNGVGRDNNAQ